MNPQIQSEKELDSVNNPEIATTEMDDLVKSGFTQDEIVSLFYLRQWYQTGGSDRVEVLRHLEFLKLMVTSGRIEP
jgi:hypothetical protein